MAAKQCRSCRTSHTNDGSFAGEPPGPQDSGSVRSSDDSDAAFVPPLPSKMRGLGTPRLRLTPQVDRPSTPMMTATSTTTPTLRRESGTASYCKHQSACDEHRPEEEHGHAVCVCVDGRLDAAQSKWSKSFFSQEYAIPRLVNDNMPFLPCGVYGLQTRIAA